ncbi:MAG: glycine betaine/L-proline ABC transporter ATP-binding protein [Candidatus Competibacteraceae bacterium]|nr:glycine betaine/L-proline ABC transporter ATP-binding protein [Candidatus Competibacteraceae bacterium]
MAKLEIHNLYKIFGPRPQKVMERVKAGQGREEILRDTGHVVGLDDVTLNIGSGQTFVVMGLSGSGKSTLIRCLNRLIDPSAGQILVDGTDVLKFNRRQLLEFRRHKVTMVFQRFGLLPHRTVLDNVAYGLMVQGVKRQEREAKARRWIDSVGLSGYENRYPDQLSGGMQQRVGLARALCTDPQILLMDEAFSALDPLIRREMQDELLRLQRELHKTIVFITHDLDEALRLGDRIAILKDGRVVQEGSREDILLRPADDYVAAFVNDVNRGRVLTAATVMAHPQAVTLAGEDTALASQPPQRDKDEYAYAVDDQQQFKGVVTGNDGQKELHQVPTVGPDEVLESALPRMLESPFPLAVVDGEGAFLGNLPRERVFEVLAGRQVEEFQPVSGRPESGG